MRERIKRLPKAVVVLLGILVAGLFLGIMDLLAALLSNVAVLPGYGNSMVSEFAAGCVAFFVLLLFGYAGILKEKGKGFIKGLYIGGFMTGYCLLEVVAQIYVQVMQPDRQVVSIIEIFYFVATMFLIGWTEELIFRGVILNLFLDRFSKTKGGILSAVILSGCIFGAVHLTNVFQGVTIQSAAVQAVTAGLLGVLLGAIYARSRNIWTVILFHAVVDFASLMGSGIFGTGSSVEQINQMSALNLVSVPVLLIPVIVLLRPKKLQEMEQEANHIVVFDTYEEADSNALTSLILGVLSILTGFIGYGLGIGITGLIGAKLSRKVKLDNNGIAFVGMILSIIGIVVSIFGAAFMTFVYANLDAAQFLGGMQL